MNSKMVSGSVEGAIRFSDVVTFDNNFEGELVEKKERIEEVFTQLSALNYIIFEGEDEKKMRDELQNLFEGLSTISKENEELKVQCFKEKKRYRGIKCTSSGEEQEDEWYRTLPLEFEDDRTPIDYWATIARPGIRWQGSRVHESHIARNDLKVVRRLLAYHWTGRRSNASKVYRTDLFALWSMDTGTPVNMGMICKTWLDSQSAEGVDTIFVGPLVSQLCIGLGYTAELAQEVRVRESEMTPFSREDMLLLEITPIPENDDMNPPPPPMPTFPLVPPHYATVTNLTTMQAFHHQLHLEAMARQQQFHLENMERQQRAEEAIHRAFEAQSAQINELREQFMRFHPHPPPE
nr:hypothetical protein CDL12_30547 [Ipomoea batatas]